MIEIIEKFGLKIPVLMTSSTQVEIDNDYGKSKLQAEKILEAYHFRNSVPVYIYRLPNVFGKWSRPNYNTVIATWCNNIVNNLDISISNKNNEITLVYIDDVINEFASRLLTHDCDLDRTHYDVNTVYQKCLGEIADLLFKFHENRETLIIPEVGVGFERALYSTYLSFIPRDRFSYPLLPHNDERGSFFEIIKTIKNGQFSVLTSLPGVTRGNHYHNTKNEKFIVIKGEAVIRFRNIFETEVFEYRVSDKKIEVVDIPVGYNHNITNTGDTEMLLLIWANELFDHQNPDTYYLEV
jgi:UDP-2-acetamido-2,6-beta-L-arabino-hexul-4-ose reductase